VLWGYAVQSHDAFELVVADDGSTQDTLLVIARMRRKTRLDIEHVWQPDLGFRKCRVLNRAIDAARGDYLIFSDGDCIPRADFVATHVRLARRGHALSGGCIRLPRAASEAITPAEILAGRCMGAGWLWTHRPRLGRSALKMVWPEVAGKVADWLTPTRATFNGHNASVWRTDALRVNGFDERMQYGGLDREFGERLANAGVRFRQVRHRAICLHLDHARPYVSREQWRHNDLIRNETRGQRLTWTRYGLRHVAAADAGPSDRAA